MMITSPCATKRRDALVERLFESAIGMLDVMSVYVGDRLGLYQVLAERSSLTARQLARATGTPFSLKQRFWAVVLLFVKDAAILSGNILGSLDGLVRPRWRRMTREYLEAGR